MGTDLVYLPRIEDLYEKFGSRFLDKVLTLSEKRFCTTPVSLKAKIARIGGRIAAKEAVVKTLGIGISTLGNPQGLLWSHIELVREERHAPRIRLMDKAAVTASALGIEDWWVSLTHDGDYALAVVMALKLMPKPQTPPPPVSLSL